MTNHHVGADTLQKISTKDKDFYKDGFLAKTKAEEVKSPDLELNVLVGIEDVTDRVNAELKEGMSDADATVARRKATAAIEAESKKKSGLRSDVVTLYQGGQYHLYTYKTYTDVRLVMAPEFDIAFFGGDPDNFEYPRYDLDVCFFRAYENDKPVKVEHYLKWSAERLEGGRPRLRRRPSRQDEPAEHDGPPPVPPRHGLSAPARIPVREGAVPPGIRQARAGAAAAVEGRPLRHPELAQGPRRRARRAEG